MRGEFHRCYLCGFLLYSFHALVHRHQLFSLHCTRVGVPGPAAHSHDLELLIYKVFNPAGPVPAVGVPVAQLSVFTYSETRPSAIVPPGPWHVSPPGRKTSPCAGPKLPVCGVCWVCWDLRRPASRPGKPGWGAAYSGSTSHSPQGSSFYLSTQCQSKRCFTNTCSRFHSDRPLFRKARGAPQECLDLLWTRG